MDDLSNFKYRLKAEEVLSPGASFLCTARALGSTVFEQVTSFSECVIH